MSNSTASEQTIKPITPALYVVATPIGNLQDITLRAIEILKQVDFIAAEDTRHSAPLLAHFGITKQCLAVHEHNEQKAAPPHPYLKVAIHLPLNCVAVNGR